MSAVDTSPQLSARPHTLTSLGALYRLLLRTQISVARILGIAALGTVSVLENN